LHIFNINPPKIALPLGISFYIFQSISYLVDVYRGTIQHSKSLINFGAYISLFPQLVAGPIVRYKDIEKSFSDRELKLNNVFYGLQRFIMGLSKKVLIADMMAVIVDHIFSAPVNTIPFSIAWAGAIAYTLQIYFDFSGYSDMAIGLGRIFNFKFPENFKYPYSAKSIQEFWRRWHISLSSFFRDYLYIPLGGNRKGKVRMYINSFIVFLLCGLWHGAAWNFVVWGLWHGLGISLEKAGFGKFLERIPKLFSTLYVWLFVILGWVVFRAPNLDYARHYLKIMFTGNAAYPLASFSNALHFDFMAISNIYILILGILLSYPIMAKFIIRHRNSILWTAGIFLLFILSYSFALTSAFTPFLYFRF
jgi:alginate O-acetyltransferase complex protein AlgI